MVGPLVLWARRSSVVTVTLFLDFNLAGLLGDDFRNAPVIFDQARHAHLLVSILGFRVTKLCPVTPPTLVLDSSTVLVVVVESQGNAETTEVQQRSRLAQRLYIEFLGKCRRSGSQSGICSPMIRLGRHFPNGKLYVWVGPGHIQE